MQSGGEMAHFKWVGGSGRREKRKIQGLFLFFFILRPFTQKCPASFCQSRSPSKVHVPLLCRSKHSKWTFSHWSESTWQPQTHRPGLIHTDTAAAEKPSVLREQKPCLLAPFFRTLAKKKEGVHSLSALRWNVFWMEILDSSFSYSQLFCMLVVVAAHGGTENVSTPVEVASSPAAPCRRHLTFDLHRGDADGSSSRWAVLFLQQRCWTSVAEIIYSPF